MILICFSQNKKLLKNIYFFDFKNKAKMKLFKNKAF